MDGDAEQIGLMFWAAIHGAVILELAGMLPPGGARQLYHGLDRDADAGHAPAGLEGVRHAAGACRGLTAPAAGADSRTQPGGAVMTRTKPFEVSWSEAQVEAVLDAGAGLSLAADPRVPDGWAYGCDAGYLKALCDHWLSAYDWRAAVADLNRFPQFTARIEDFDIHFLHVVGEASGKRPLIVTHGWPGSHYEFWRRSRSWPSPAASAARPRTPSTS